MIYGPAGAVEIWAAKRFDLIDDHVKKYQLEGQGIHSEKFLSRTVFPAIERAGFVIEESGSLCFLRARADETVWVHDCSKGAYHNVTITNEQSGFIVAETIGRGCYRSILRDAAAEPGTMQMRCDGNRLAREGIATELTLNAMNILKLFGIKLSYQWICLLIASSGTNAKVYHSFARPLCTSKMMKTKRHTVRAYRSK